MGRNGSYCYENVLGIQDVSPGAALFHASRVVCQRRIKSPVKEGPKLIRQERDPGYFHPSLSSSPGP